MNENIHDLLNDAIARHFDDISQLQVGTNEMSSAIDDVKKLYELRIKENATEWEANDRDSRREMEENTKRQDYELKNHQLENDYNIKVKQLEEQATQRELDDNNNKREQDIKRLQVSNDGIFKSGQLNEQIAHRNLEEKIFLSDSDYKAQQIAEQKIDRYVKVGMWVGGGVATLMATAIVLAYEKENAITMTGVKEVIKAALRIPKK